MLLTGSLCASPLPHQAKSISRVDSAVASALLVRVRLNTLLANRSATLRCCSHSASYARCYCLLGLQFQFPYLTTEGSAVEGNEEKPEHGQDGNTQRSICHKEQGPTRFRPPDCRRMVLRRDRHVLGWVLRRGPQSLFSPHTDREVFALLGMLHRRCMFAHVAENIDRCCGSSSEHLSSQ